MEWRGVGVEKDTLHYRQTLVGISPIPKMRSRKMIQSQSSPSFRTKEKTQQKKWGVVVVMGEREGTVGGR